MVKKISGTKMLILYELANEPKSISELARSLGLKPSTIYHHLKELMELGIVKVVGTTTKGNLVVKLYGLSEQFENALKAFQSSQPDTLRKIIRESSRAIRSIIEGKALFEVLTIKVAPDRVDEVMKEVKRMIEELKRFDNGKGKTLRICITVSQQS